MSGSTSGILIGAVSTWKPFGGGAFMTTSGGGGLGSSLGGGGSSFLTWTNSTFSAFGLLELLARVERPDHCPGNQDSVNHGTQEGPTRTFLL